MSALHALLIGIDGYEPNSVFGDQGYAPLGGCVRDIETVEAYLQKELDMPPARILKLIAPREGEPYGSPELAVRRPTYEGFVGAFERLTQVAEPGDEVYIHYCGHGGVVKPLFPEVKTDRGCDETLVPVNVGSPEARHLRDVETFLLLRRLVERGLTVTIVLDCCHSGGGLRTQEVPPNPPGAWARGIPCFDLTERPKESLVASHAELLARFQAAGLPPAGTRSGGPRSVLRKDERWVLLAACREDQRAYEIKVDGEKRGAFTHCWLKALRQGARRSSCRELFEQAQAEVRGLRPAQQNLQQTPQILGDGDRIAFGKKHLPSRSSVRVLEVKGERLVLDAGAIHGVAKRARFALYPAGTKEDDPAVRRGEAEITQLGSSTSRARRLGKAGPLEAGDKATLLDPGALGLRRAVRVDAVEGAPAAHRKALDLLTQGLAMPGSDFIYLAKGAGSPHYTVRVNDGGQFEVRDPWGEALAFPVVPPLSITEERAVPRFVQRLIHLAKFENVADLPRPHGARDLDGKLELSWTDPPSETAPRVQAGEVARLKVSNLSSRDVFLSAIALRSDGSIQSVTLGDEAAASFGMRGKITNQKAGQTREFEIPARLLDGQTWARERLRVFAMLEGEANFQWLDLSPWDGKSLSRPAWRKDDPLSQLFAALAWEARPRVVVEADPYQEWTVETVELEIVG